MNINDMVIVSVDDHVSEPPDMYERHLKGDALAAAPKFRMTDKGTHYWEYQGMRLPSVGLNAVVGRPFEEYGMEPSRLDQIRPGVYDVHERIKDMNVNGIAASLNFGGKMGFDGGRFHAAPDKEMALIHLRAWNDWHVQDWAGAYPGRFIACGLLPTWDMDATVAEVKRLAGMGVTAVSIADNPTKYGLPSIHNKYWEPLWKAATENDVALCLHIGAGNSAPHASMETPIEAWITTMPMSISVGAADWLHLEALHRYPDMKVALSEGGIGWIPYFTERSDFSHWRHHAWTHSDFGKVKPSEVFHRHFLCCFIDDQFGLHNLQHMNEDMVAYECDYPHSDTLWPNSPEHLHKSLKHLTDVQIDKITHGNALRFFSYDMFGKIKREELNVGALRAQAVAAGVDTSTKSSGGAAPLAAGEQPRVITSGDIVKMFNTHEEAA